jgi:hypothetical protein
LAIHDFFSPEVKAQLTKSNFELVRSVNAVELAAVRNAIRNMPPTMQAVRQMLTSKSSVEFKADG